MTPIALLLIGSVKKRETREGLAIKSEEIKAGGEEEHHNIANTKINLSV